MNPSTFFCDNCGAANQPQDRFCSVCGQAMPVPTPVAPVEKPVMTNLHPQGYSCPRCGTSDYVEKVSSVVGTAPTGRFAGSPSVITSQADVRQKLALPSAPVYKSPWNFTTVFVFGLVVLVVLACVSGVISWLQALLKAPHDSGVLGNFVALTIFTLIWVALAVFIVWSRRYIARDRRAKVASWQSVRARWEQTYYCAQDDVVFLPEEQGTYKPASEMVWFLHQTPT